MWWRESTIRIFVERWSVCVVAVICDVNFSLKSILSSISLYLQIHSNTTVLPRVLSALTDREAPQGIRSYRGRAPAAT